MQNQALKNTVIKIKNANGRLHNGLQIPKDIINKKEDMSEHYIEKEVNKGDGKSTNQT